VSRTTLLLHTLHMKNNPAPYVNGATAEKPWDRKKFKTYGEALGDMPCGLTACRR